jgi:hypothetical protein
MILTSDRKRTDLVNKQLNGVGRYTGPDGRVGWLRIVVEGRRSDGSAEMFTLWLSPEDVAQIDRALDRTT